MAVVVDLGKSAQKYDPEEFVEEAESGLRRRNRAEEPLKFPDRGLADKGHSSAVIRSLGRRKPQPTSALPARSSQAD